MSLHQVRDPVIEGTQAVFTQKVMSCCESDSLPGEVLKMLEQEGVSLSDLEPAPLDTM